MLGLTKKSKDKKKTKKDKKVEEEVCETEEISEEDGKQVTLVDLLSGGAEEAGPENRSIMFVG